MNLSIPGKSSSHPDVNNREEEPAVLTPSLPHKRRRRALLALPAVFVAALGLAACSSAGATSPSSSSGGAPVYGSATPSPSKTPAPTASGTALALRSTSLGRILTDGRGFTVYDFEADQGTTSNCSGACATAWPPVLAKVAAPKVGTGVEESLVGQTTRADGTKQLTYGGRPLYYYAGDSAPGSTTGQGSRGFGAPWYVLTASGQEPNWALPGKPASAWRKASAWSWPRPGSSRPAYGRLSGQVATPTRPPRPRHQPRQATDAPTAAASRCSDERGTHTPCEQHLEPP